MANNAPNPQIPLILTRPLTRARAFYDGLPAEMQARLLPVFSPLVDIVPRDVAVPIGSKDAAIFTSQSAVAAGPDGAGRVAYCVGPATTRAAEARGWQAQQVGHDADSLVAGLISHPPAAQLVHVSGAHTRGEVAVRLGRAGLTVNHIVVYDQVLRPLKPAACEAITRESRVIVPLFSPRTAIQFAKTAPRATSICVAALSPAVAEAAAPIALGGLRIASAPNASALCDAIRGLL